MDVLNNLFRKGRYAEALEVIEEYEVEYDILPGEYLLAKAFCLVCLNRKEEALNLDLDDIQLWELAVLLFDKGYYDFAKEFFELLKVIDEYSESASEYLEKITRYKKLCPGCVVTISGLSVACQENYYRPSFSNTRDGVGTEYLIWGIDVANDRIYALPLSKVEDKFVYKIAGKKYGPDVSDRWGEAIVRVFSASDITNVVGKLEEFDLEKTLSTVYNSFIFSARGKEIPNYAVSFVDYIVDRRKETVKPGFLLEYKDYSTNLAGVIRSFCVFEVDDDKKIYRTFEMKKAGKKRYWIDSSSIVEFPMDFHFCLAVSLNDKALKQNMRNYASQFGKNPGTTIMCAISPLLPLSSKGNSGFRVAPAGACVGYAHGSLKMKK